MSERGLPIADSATACPFVAFEDDRDERATVPDHRHRCYADVRPSPRALAHQEAYCLSSSFPVCPTFQDWARRESARARADAQAREDADAADRAAGPAAGAAAAGAAAADAAAAGAAGLAAAGASGAASGAADHASDADAGMFDREARPSVAGSHDPDDDDDDESTDTRRGDDDGEPRRNPPRDWSAPPPWLASSEAARAHTSPPPDFLAHRAAEPGQGLAGSAADRLAGGSPVSSSPAAAWREPEADDERLSGRGAPLPRRPRAYDQHLGGPSSGPDWERPRRYEAYPTIKTRVGMPAIPRIAVLAALIALAALAFFFLPAILGLGSKSGPGGGGASPSAAVAPSVSTEPTTAPAATPILYTIKKNETLSKIATAHGITLQQLLAANPTIKNPNKIVEGQQITIPVPQSSVPDEFGPSGSPAASQ